MAKSFPVFLTPASYPPAFACTLTGFRAVALRIVLAGGDTLANENRVKCGGRLDSVAGHLRFIETHSSTVDLGDGLEFHYVLELARVGVTDTLTRCAIYDRLSPAVVHTVFSRDAYCCGRGRGDWLIDAEMLVDRPTPPTEALVRYVIQSRVARVVGCPAANVDVSVLTHSGLDVRTFPAGFRHGVYGVVVRRT